MAIKHTIRKNGNGEMVEVNLTPARAIRKHCTECMGFAWSEIDGCTSPSCALFPYRHGKTPIGYEIVDPADQEPLIDGEEPKQTVFTPREKGRFTKKQ